MLTDDFKAITLGLLEIRYRYIPNDEDHGLSWRGEVWKQDRCLHGAWFRSVRNIVSTALRNFPKFYTDDIEGGE